jgi:hypothetical protein
MTNTAEVFQQLISELHSALRWKTDNHQFCILREDSCAQNFLHSPGRVLSQFKSFRKTMRNTLTKSYRPLSWAYSCLQDDPARNSLESSEELFSVFNSEKIRELNTEFYEAWQKKNSASDETPVNLYYEQLFDVIIKNLQGFWLK